VDVDGCEVLPEETNKSSRFEYGVSLIGFVVPLALYKLKATRFYQSPISNTKFLIKLDMLGTSDDFTTKVTV
jgi:hypothetical protein